MSCSTGKRSYITEHQAEEALLGARINYAHNKAVAVYQCDECGEWHLTSSGKLNKKLKQALNEGNINKEAESRYWDEKLK